MTGYTQELAREKENKKKSRRFAIFFHFVLLALLIYPFMQPGTPDEPDFETAVVIDFTEFDKQASKKSSQRAQGKIAKQRKKPAPKRASEPKPEPTPQPKPAAKPKRKPVVTSPTPEPKIETSKEESKVEAPKPVPVPAPAPTPQPEEVPEENFEDNAPATPVETDATAEDNAGVPDATANAGNGAGVGNDADGSADEANNGTANEGNNGMDFSGDGLLTRPIVHRADVKKITRETGKIVINICVSRSGRVVYAKYNDEDSSIETTSLIREALATAKQYRFERDYTLPAKQCGKLTFIFDVD
ncbi:MAG: hypothetical protein AAFO94_02200 [Bacteroidota bacterium]